MDRPNMIGLLAAVVAVNPPEMKERAGMAMDTNGSRVQSSTQRKDARLETSMRRSFNVAPVVVGDVLVVSTFKGLLKIWNEVFDTAISSEYALEEGSNTEEDSP